ncbi:MAG TPA: hypothetical protein VGM29_17205 [Polyangiaceae bacterium]|jgi:hypothetical protein
MQTPVDEQFVAEAERFRLRFTCEVCAHFDGGERCGHGYPTEAHRNVDLARRATLEFCKEFELV